MKSVAIICLFLAPPALGGTLSPLETGLPDTILTPGATNPNVTQENIGQTICVHGWTSTIRPPTSYTTPLKEQQMVQYGFATDVTDAAAKMGDYEEDHLISLELGGSPTDPKNLWPEPHHTTPLGRGSFAKDAFENWLHRAVCDGKLTLAQARRAIAKDWILGEEILKGN